jgi:GntR family transcriptional regulator / MocR family aminotransferase
MPVDPGSTEPLYRQVYALIEEAIVTGRVQGKLPSSRDLAARLGVSRNTVQTAYQQLTAEGYVSSRPRSGLVVNRDMLRVLDEQARGMTTAEAPPEIPIWRRLTEQSTLRLPYLRKPTDWHRYPHPFLGGQIDIQAFPRLAWIRALKGSMEGPHLRWSLQDSRSDDDPLLVEMICKTILPGRGIAAQPHQVMITLGSQEALALSAEALCRPGIRVSVESPGYPDAWHIFARAQARLVPQQVDEAGMRVDDSIRDTPLIYVTPSHQFPTNATLSIARRKRLLSLAAEHDLLVLEDDYDSELRYRGHTTPALKAMDTEHRVIYLGSFSKFLAPGLRLGFMVGHPELITSLRQRRQYTVRHPPGQLQRAMALFILSGDYGRALTRMRTTMKRKWLTIVEAAEAHLPAQFLIPAGGTSLWLEGPADLDGMKLAREAQTRGVLLEPGELFFLEAPRPRHYFKLGYSSIPENRVATGIELLGGVIRQQAR